MADTGAMGKHDCGWQGQEEPAELIKAHKGQHGDPAVGLLTGLCCVFQQGHFELRLSIMAYCCSSVIIYY